MVLILLVLFLALWQVSKRLCGIHYYLAAGLFRPYRVDDQALVACFWPRHQRMLEDRRALDEYLSVISHLSVNLIPDFSKKRTGSVQ
jgi:hypothetical protein